MSMHLYPYEELCKSTKLDTMQWTVYIQVTVNIIGACILQQKRTSFSNFNFRSSNNGYDNITYSGRNVQCHSNDDSKSVLFFKAGYMDGVLRHLCIWNSDGVQLIDLPPETGLWPKSDSTILEKFVMPTKSDIHPNIGQCLSKKTPQYTC